jgi:hypothetical protein
MTNRLGRKLLSSGAALAILVGASAAHAEVVTYNFAALINSADSTELKLVGLPASGQITGSLTYDSDAGWWGGSNSYADPSLDLTIDQMPPTTTTATWLTVEYNQGQFLIHQDQYNSSYTQVGARLTLTGQSATVGDLPSSLAFGSSSGGTLQLFIGGNFGDVDLSAKLTSLTRAGSATVGASAPELDPASGGAVLALVLGGATVLVANRRRRADQLA